LLQTHHPEHPLLRTLLAQGYGGLAAQLLRERRDAELPPFAHLALLRAEAATRAAVDEFLALAMELFGTADHVTALGPLPAPMPLRAGLHRAQALLSARERAPLHAVLPAWLARLRALPQARRVRWSLDVDPIDLY
jgi:primosomal protein N' (replication factor Y)